MDLIAIFKQFGLCQDCHDLRQFKGNGHRISVAGFKWFDHAQHKGGYGEVDLCMHLGGLSYVQAVMLCTSQLKPNGIVKVDSREAIKSYLPIKEDRTWRYVRGYLLRRGLSALIVDWCYAHNMIYSDARNNCVLVYGHGGEVQGIGNKPFKRVYGEVTRGFYLPARYPISIAVVEGAIDAISYRQLNSKYHAVIACAGNSNKTIMMQAVELSKRLSVPLLSAFDNDDGGLIGHRTLEKIVGERVERVKPVMKDWNEDLKLSFPQ